MTVMRWTQLVKLEPVFGVAVTLVKAVGTLIAPNRLRSLYFTRATAPWGEGALYHHIGLYAYRRAALQRFVRLAPSPLERRENLEQLRALEAGMRIDVAIVDTVPLGVDTPEDLETARAMLEVGGRTTDDRGRMKGVAAANLSSVVRCLASATASSTPRTASRRCRWRRAAPRPSCPEP